jgi:hypothetical protein
MLQNSAPLATVSVVQDMEQRDHEVSGLRSEIEKLKRRELGWATELQDAATVTSQLTERMEILESVLATKEEALSQAQVCFASPVSTGLISAMTVVALADVFFITAALAAVGSFGCCSNEGEWHLL